jgi:hypothetical protein
MDEQNQPSTPTPLSVRRAENFASLYANQVVVKQNAWDLNLAFGELDQGDDTNVLTILHTGVTIPWPAAKVLSYLIQAHVMGYEAENGTIIVPSNALPTVPELPANLVGTKTEEAFKEIRQLYREYFAA